jgi:hypothetical protein
MNYRTAEQRGIRIQNPEELNTIFNSDSGIPCLPQASVFSKKTGRETKYATSCGELNP